MRVKLNYDDCTAPRAYCRHCLHRFLQDPIGLGHSCPSMVTEENGSSRITLDVVYQERTISIEITPETRVLIEQEGWYAFIASTP